MPGVGSATMLSAQRRRREPALASFGAAGTALLILLNLLVNERHLSESLPTLNFFYPQASPQGPAGNGSPGGRIGRRTGEVGGRAPDRGPVSAFSLAAGAARPAWLGSELVAEDSLCLGVALAGRHVGICRLECDQQLVPGLLVRLQINTSWQTRFGTATAGSRFPDH